MISDLVDNNTPADAAEPPKAKSRPTKKAKPAKKMIREKGFARTRTCGFRAPAIDNQASAKFERQVVRW